MKTKRKIKFSLGMKIASILSCVALVSVGFASWWIIKPTDPVTKSGSFTVYGVSEKQVTITGDVVDAEDSTIIFGYQAPDAQNTIQYNWLYPNNVLEQNLDSEFTFDVTLTGLEAGEELGIDDLVQNVVVTVAPKEANLENFKLAVSEGYIAQPTLKYGDVTGIYDTTTATITLKIPATGFTGTQHNITDVIYKVDWGTKFGSKNPYIYYNNLEYATAYETAKTDLGKLNTYLSNVQYDVTVSVESKSLATN